MDLALGTGGAARPTESDSSQVSTPARTSLPSQLYGELLSLPGSTQYRLAPDLALALKGGASACANLWLAGDWTRNPINLGYVEATTMRGLQAARGLTGNPLTTVAR